MPWLWFLTRTADCRIFQTMTVPDIIKQVFRDQGFTDFKDSLSGTYTAWENCVQYRETDFNFVSRLMEHEGIYYFFTHENGKHTLVLADSVVRTSLTRLRRRSLSAPARRRPHPRNHRRLDLGAGSAAGHVRAERFQLRDAQDLAARQVADQHPAPQITFEMYDYPGEYGKQATARDYSKVRIEELHSQHEVVHGTGNARGLAVGFTFTLTSSPRRDQNRKYLITSATYHLTGDQLTASSSGGGRRKSSLAASRPWTRPSPSARRASRPSRSSRGRRPPSSSAPSGEEIHTDQYGRISVQFHWDRYGKADENSSCWVRVSPGIWAGKKCGSMHIPRVGHEVIVEFLEGDPDLPIVTGRVYNADGMPPYDLPANKTMTTFKSASSTGASGFNELRFEDKTGSEQIFIHAEKDYHLRVKNDRLETILNDRHLHVTNNKFEKVDANRHEEIAISHFEKIGTDHNLDIGGKQALHVTGSQSCGIDGDVIYEIGGNTSEKFSGKMYTSVTGDLVIESAASITIKVGGSSIAIDASGIALKADAITITGNNTLDLKSVAATVAGDSSVKVSGAQVKVAADAAVEVTGGATGKFDGGGVTTIKGGAVMIN